MPLPLRDDHEMCSANVLTACGLLEEGRRPICSYATFA